MRLKSFLISTSACAILLQAHFALGQIKPAGEVVGKYRNVFTVPPSHIPSQVTVDAPLLGNGFTAAAIAGEPEQQNYYLARNDFWRLKSKVDNSFPAVLGKLSIHIPGLKRSKYRIEQDLYTAITYSTFSKGDTIVKMCSVLAAGKDVLLIDITNSSKVILNGNVELDLPDTNQLQRENKFEDTATKGSDNQGTQWIQRGFVKDVDITTNAVAACKILGSTNNTFSLAPGKTITIVCAFSSNFKNPNPLQWVKKEVKGATRQSALKAVYKHKLWWRSYWNESSVNIGDPLIEHQYYRSQYNMAASCRDPKFPPGIFGSWITKEIPFWNGDYHLNYNYSAPFYALYSSNHLRQALPYEAPLIDFMPRGRFYSKQLTQSADGILYPVGIGPLGIETTRLKADSGMFWGQKSNAAYCVTDLAIQFYRTYDENFTRRVYPFVKATAIFWQHYLKKNGDRYIIEDDAVQEGAYGTFNSILSLGLVPMVFKTAIDMSTILGVDKDLRSDWQEKSDHIARYPLQVRDGKTVFRYSEKGPAWWDDNTLGIQHIYPVGAIGLNSDPKLLEVARNTIAVMHRWQDFNGSNSFFPAAVRVGYSPDTILHQLRKYCTNTYPNGFRKGNPHGIENCSTVPNTINEMLCMSNQNLLRVFQVWPRDKDAAFYNIRCEGAFLVSSELKKEQVKYVRVMSEKGHTLVLQNPWPGRMLIINSNKTAPRKLSGERLTINTSRDEVLTVTCGGDKSALPR